MKAAIITAQGIGDGLIMMIISYHLKRLGYEVTVFNKHLFSFYSWFEGYHFSYPFDIENAKHFDLIILQHDNTEIAKKVTALRNQNRCKNLYILYTNYRLNKHGKINTKYDFPYDSNRTMVENTTQALKVLFSIKHASKENGINIPKHLVFQKHHQRILLHPTSADISKNWSIHSFIKVAKILQNHGFDPHFLVSPKEKPHWTFLEKMGFALPDLPTLSHLASHIYESKILIGNDSGPAHLASNLYIPTLVIAKRKTHMNFWKPDWGKGIVILPPKWIPNLKHFRLKDKYWKLLIRPSHVLKKALDAIHK